MKQGTILKLKDTARETDNFKRGDLVVFDTVKGNGNYRLSTLDKPVVYRGVGPAHLTKNIFQVIWEGIKNGCRG